LISESRHKADTVAKLSILEDDYFSEYRYGGASTASLQSIDQDKRVIYIGNFSKSIAPSLRIGYLVLPPALVESFQRVRFTMSRQPPGVEQAILAEFIRQGHLERFVRATLRTYRERKAALVDAINMHAKGLLETSPSGTGMYLVAWLNPGIDDQGARTTIRNFMQTQRKTNALRSPLDTQADG